MKLLLDEHLSRKLVAPLQDLYPGTTHVVAEGLASALDTQVWSFAAENDLVIATKDSDFQLMSFARGHPPKVVLLQIGNGPTKAALAILLSSYERMRGFRADAGAALLILP